MRRPSCAHSIRSSHSCGWYCQKLPRAMHSCRQCDALCSSAAVSVQHISGATWIARPSDADSEPAAPLRRGIIRCISGRLVGGSALRRCVVFHDVRIHNGAHCFARIAAGAPRSMPPTGAFHSQCATLRAAGREPMEGETLHATFQRPVCRRVSACDRPRAAHRR